MACFGVFGFWRRRFRFFLVKIPLRGARSPDMAIRANGLSPK